MEIYDLTQLEFSKHNLIIISRIYSQSPAKYLFINIEIGSIECSKKIIKVNFALLWQDDSLYSLVIYLILILFLLTL